jgi:5-(carboxyamino)imidazole ribonucleotide mutase
MTASVTHLPVIGVPIPTKNLNGLDSLLSIVQMPSGIPVATVAIGNSRNAALLALRILSIKYPEIKKMVQEYMESEQKRVLGESV